MKSNKRNTFWENAQAPNHPSGCRRVQVLASERGQGLSCAPFEAQVPRGAQATAQGLSWAAGQGTVEYLVIIAVVVVLSLVVVGVVITQTQSGANVSSTANEISSKTGLLAVSNVSLNSVDGNFFVSVKNNDADAITITSVLVNSDS
ncbi:MAG: hypothetical protein WCW44_02060, partial [archaeon]